MAYYKNPDEAKHGAKMGYGRPDYDYSKSAAHNEYVKQAYDSSVNPDPWRGMFNKQPEPSGGGFRMITFRELLQNLYLVLTIIAVVGFFLLLASMSAKRTNAYSPREIKEWKAAQSETVKRSAKGPKARKPRRTKKAKAQETVETFTSPHTDSAQN